MVSHGKSYENQVTLEDIEFARMITTRFASDNYYAIINSNEATINTLFSVIGLKGPFKEASISGCGEINPLENDPLHRVIGVGTRVLLNGASGYIIGKGTRARSSQYSLSVFVDMKEMDSSMMGGIKTSYGPECYAMRMCPTEAISNYFLINKELCINCGTCTHQCAMGVFNARLGSIELAHTKIDYGHICGETNEKIYSVSPQQSAENGLVNEASELSWLTIPVTLRQSNRARAEELCTILKNRILNKEFPINRMKGPLKYNEGNVPKVP